jgi:hypothetical protein
MKPMGRRAMSAALLSCLASTACDQGSPSPRPLPGYVHRFDRSRFNAGDIVAEIDESGMHKFVGTNGTFATDLATKAVVGMADVPIPDPVFGVYPGTDSDQNAAVRAYFVSAGLPDGQVASVSAFGTGFVKGDDVLEGWYSLLNRTYEGIPIVDSIATALFEADGRSGHEEVHWPEIPAQVLEQALAFQTMLADPARQADFIQKLPAGSRAGGLVIRHTSWFWDGAFRAEACWRGPASNDLCFDSLGHPILNEATGGE